MNNYKIIECCNFYLITLQELRMFSLQWLIKNYNALKKLIFIIWYEGCDRLDTNLMAIFKE